MELELPQLLAPDLPSIRSSPGRFHRTHSEVPTRKSQNTVIPVTASLEEHGAIFVTAATHRSKRRFSGVFSGVGPKTPVIHDRHGSPIHYRRNLMDKNHDRLGSLCKEPRLALWFTETSCEGWLRTNASRPFLGKGQFYSYWLLVTKGIRSDSHSRVVE